MGYNDRPTPVQDMITSAMMGVVLGFTVFVIAEATGVIDSVFRAAELSEIGTRIDVTHFVILGAILGVVLDLIGKLTPMRPGKRSS